MSYNIRIFGYIDKGYTGHSVMVECSIRNGFPGFDITGLPGASVKEARERVRCALRSCNFRFPQSRILVNLSPASQTKDSTLLDLPLACSILCSMEKQNRQKDRYNGGTINVMIAGELTLDGNVLQSPHSIGALDAEENEGCSIGVIPVTIPSYVLKTCRRCSLSAATSYAAQYRSRNPDRTAPGRTRSSSRTSSV